MIKLFVVGYPPDMQEVELIELFVLYGMIHSIDMVKDKVTHKSLGYCFMEMVDQAGADRAIDAINGTLVRGRKLTVKLALEKNGEKKAVTHDGIHRKIEKRDSQGGAAKNKRPRKFIIP